MGDARWTHGLGDTNGDSRLGPSDGGSNGRDAYILRDGGIVHYKGGEPFSNLSR